MNNNDIKVGDYVTRLSYNNDTLFKVLRIDNSIVYLKGEYVRLYADSNINDLVKSDNKKDDFILDRSNQKPDDDYFYLPGKILHIDSDNEYLEKCLSYYKEHNVYAVGKKVLEEDVKDQIGILIEKIKPDIIVITGHDSYSEKKGKKDDLSSYKNSLNFVKAVNEARKYEKSHEKLIIIAGACQSDYEGLIKAGANFASSPKRVNIHALDPAIVATSVALTPKNEQIDLKHILKQTRFGYEGMGGIITNGLMYVGFPR